MYKKIEEICDQLSEYLDSDKCKEIKKHLEDCPTCCAYVDTIRKTIELYKELPEDYVPEDVQERLMKVLKL